MKRETTNIIRKYFISRGQIHNHLWKFVSIYECEIRTSDDNFQIPVQQSNPWYHMWNNRNWRFKYFHRSLFIKAAGGSLNSAFVDGHVDSFTGGGIKAGWFKVGKWWKDENIISDNDPTGP